MFLYNVTIGIDLAVEQEWLQWMREIHIPEVLEAGKFYEHRMFKVLVEPEGGTISYSVQYYANSIEDIVKYLEQHAPAIIEKHRKKFEGQHVIFQTLLEEI